MNGAQLGLGRIGNWSTSIQFSPEGGQAAPELEELGFKKVSIRGRIDCAVLESLDQLLDATSGLNFATGIINIWRHEPAQLVAWWQTQSDDWQAGLFLASA